MLWMSYNPPCKNMIKIYLHAFLQFRELLVMLILWDLYCCGLLSYADIWSPCACCSQWSRSRNLRPGKIYQYLQPANRLSKFDLAASESQSLTVIHLTCLLSAPFWPEPLITQQLESSTSDNTQQAQQNNRNWWGLAGCAFTLGSPRLGCHVFYFLSYIWGEASPASAPLLNHCLYIFCQEQ